MTATCSRWVRSAEASEILVSCPGRPGHDETAGRVPSGTPEPVITRISAALEAALATPEVQQKLDTAGCEAKSAALATLSSRTRPLWAKVVKEAGITAD